MKLRDYQVRALQAETAHRAEHPEETRLAIVLPTGTGKGTLIAARAVSAIEDVMFSGRVLVIAHTEEIISDLVKRCQLLAGQSEFPITVGIVKAEKEYPAADIVIASAQTLANPERRARISNVGLVIVDECHHATAASYQAIMEDYGCFRSSGAPMPPTPALGFTATLERADGQGLGTVWQNVCFTRDTSWAVRRGYLVQPIGHRLEIGLLGEDEDGSRRFTESLRDQDAQLIEALAPEAIVAKWLELAKGRPTVAFMPLVRSAEALEEAFEAAGIRAGVIHGGMPDRVRRAQLAEFEMGEIQVLCNAMVLTEGWDCERKGWPECVIVGRPTKSRSLFIQMVGRGLRPDPLRPVEEQDCIIIAVSDATTDLCSIADLSDRPLDRRAQGALTVMEDQWDIGKALDEEEQAKLWTGRVDIRQFDPLAQRSSKVWRATEHGTPFLPIGKGGEYVFIVGTEVWVREKGLKGYSRSGFRSVCIHADLPDLETALLIAEDEATERGGDVGALLADRSRPWRKAKPAPDDKMVLYARRLGLGAEVDAILAGKGGGKAGRISDLISKVEATRVLEPTVERIKNVRTWVVRVLAKEER